MSWVNAKAASLNTSPCSTSKLQLSTVSNKLPATQSQLFSIRPAYAAAKFHHVPDVSACILHIELTQAPALHKTYEEPGSAVHENAAPLPPLRQHGRNIKVHYLHWQQPRVSMRGTQNQ